MNNSIFKKILFGGYYGMDNIGDDCFGIVSSWGAKKYWNSENAYLLSSRKLKSPIKTNSSLTKKEFFRGQRTIESTLQIIKSTSVVWSGGSIFHSKNPIYSPKYLSALASTLGITPAGAIGVSLGPFKTISDQKSVYNTLRTYRFLALRDRSSYETALSLGLPFKPVLAADLAMLLPLIEEVRPSKQIKGNILGITICHYERYVSGDIQKEKRRESVLVKSLIKLLDKGFNGVFRLFTFNSNSIFGDKDITLKLFNILKEHNANVELIYYSTNAIDIWHKVSECAAMISTRLHGGIFSAAANVPCCLIEYHPKCTEFVLDIGVHDKWVIGDANCSSDTLAYKLIELLDLNEINFYSNRDKIIKLAENNFKGIISQDDKH